MGLRCWRSHFRHEVAARAVLVGMPGRAVQWGARAAWVIACGGDPSQLYCNGVQWVTFKFNLKF